jgi:biopolymer transport protein ExbD
MAQDNEPVKLNMTPMIDVVFQLIVFFLVSMKFKSLDMKIEANLPSVGPDPTPRREPEPPKVDVRLRSAGHGRPAEIRVAGSTLGDAASEASWARLEEHLATVRGRQASIGLAPEDIVGEVDASPAVPTGLVVRALDTLRGGGFRDVRFVGTKPLN